MKVRQINVNKDNIVDHLNNENLYIIRMSTKTRNTKAKEPYPYGLTFKHFMSTHTLPEALEILDGKGCVVEVLKDE